MALQNEIQKWRGEIKTDGYEMSIGELMSLYKEEELLLRPKFQRFFRWTLQQKSKFIESILLGIPIPSIFVAQRGTGVWEVIDGLQRLSTLFEFAGVLRDADGNLKPPLILEGTRYLPSLDGKAWGSDESESESRFLTPSQRIDIKRAKISIKIILKESERFTKFELFQRLNTGASLASDQEVRNCMLVDTNESFFDWLEQLGSDSNFNDCISLSDKKSEEQYGLELVSRFLVFRKLPAAELRGLGHIGDLLNARMLDLAERDDYDRAREERAFTRTFEVLAAQMEGNAFRKYDTQRKCFRGGFLISAFEGVALGVGYNVERLGRGSQKLPIFERIKALWGNDEFLEWTGVGRSAGSRIPHSIKIGRRLFRP